MSRMIPGSTKPADCHILPVSRRWPARLTAVFTVFASLVLGVAPASASERASESASESASATASASASAGLIVTPGGLAEGFAADVAIEVRSPLDDFHFPTNCVPASIGLDFSSSARGHFADLTEVAFLDCLIDGVLGFAVLVETPLELHALSFDGSTVTGEIRDFVGSIVFPGCQTTIEGTVPVTYSNITKKLTMIPRFTMTFTSVDPVDDCLGLFREGDEMAFSGAFDIVPPQTVVRGAVNR